MATGRFVWQSWLKVYPDLSLSLGYFVVQPTFTQLNLSKMGLVWDPSQVMTRKPESSEIKAPMQQWWLGHWNGTDRVQWTFWVLFDDRQKNSSFSLKKVKMIEGSNDLSLKIWGFYWNLEMHGFLKNLSSRGKISNMLGQLVAVGSFNLKKPTTAPEQNQQQPSPSQMGVKHQPLSPPTTPRMKIKTHVV